MSKAKKILKLDDAYDFEFTLIGIFCHQKLYKLCWAINKELGFKFSKTNNYEIGDEKLPSTFAQFFHEDIERDKMYYLIENKGEKKTNSADINSLFDDSATIEHLIPEHKQIDFLLLIKPLTEGKEVVDLLNKLRGISFINSAQEIKTENLSSKHNLLF